MWPSRKFIPDCVEIGDGIWEIQFKRKIIEGGVDCTGLCDPGDKVLSIKYPMSKREQFSTILHETVHAISFEKDLDLTEKEVVAIEEGIMQLLEQVLFNG